MKHRSFKGKQRDEQWMPCWGMWNGSMFSVNGVDQPGITKRLVSLVTVIDNLPGSGKLSITTMDERQSEYRLPSTDRQERANLFSRLGNAMVIVGGVTIRLRQPQGEDHLYGFVLGNGRCHGCTAQEVRESYTMCPCCGDKSGEVCSHEICCDFPEVECARTGSVN